MKTTKTRNLLVALLALSVSLSILGLPVFAHHSNAPFDMEHPMTLKGVVTGFNWANPHAYIAIDVKSADGKVANWSVQTAAPNFLHRNGWTRDMLKPGDQITILGFPAKDGTKNLRLDTLTLANGQTFRPYDRNSTE